jgi:hypothetical protein
LTDFGLCVSGQELCQRLDGVSQPDAPESERRAAPDARFPIAEKA